MLCVRVSMYARANRLSFEAQCVDRFISNGQNGTRGRWWIRMNAFYLFVDVSMLRIEAIIVHQAHWAQAYFECFSQQPFWFDLCSLKSRIRNDTEGHSFLVKYFRWRIPIDSHTFHFASMPSDQKSDGKNNRKSKTVDGQDTAMILSSSPSSMHRKR